MEFQNRNKALGVHFARLFGLICTNLLVEQTASVCFTAAFEGGTAQKAFHSQKPIW